MGPKLNKRPGRLNEKIRYIFIFFMNVIWFQLWTLLKQGMGNGDGVGQR